MARLRTARDGKPLRTPATGFPGFVQDRRAPRIVTGDIWGCLRYIVKFHGERISRERTRQALAHIDQAYEFYAAAENPQIGSRPLLYYYSFLNLAKAFLLDSGLRLPALAKHGISDPRANVRRRLRLEGQRVRIAAPAADKSEISPEFVNALAGSYPTRKEFRVLDLLGQMPAVHRAYTQVLKRPSSFLPVDRFDLLTDGAEVWARCVIKRSGPDIRQVFRMVSAQNAFHRVLVPIQSGEVTEAWFETYPVTGQRRGIDAAVARLAQRVRALGLWAILTSTGYRYYLGVDSARERLPQLAGVYAVMFYLGSITRYKPYDFGRIIESRYAWIVNEFLAAQPHQFLHLLASTMAGVDVVRPWALP